MARSRERLPGQSREREKPRRSGASGGAFAADQRARYVSWQPAQALLMSPIAALVTEMLEKPINFAS